jgi:hypothetical protein
MKFIIKKPFRENIYNLMRKAGYHFLRKDGQKDEFEFARPTKGYPRFHLFVNVGNDAMIFKLHLDQKAPIYEGVPAHAGEYDSETVKKEAERIKQILK